MGLMEKIASWWIGLSRADLDAEAERRAQQWKIEKKEPESSSPCGRLSRWLGSRHPERPTESPRSMRIALHAPSGYVVAEQGGDDVGIVRANRSEIGAWETWTIEPHPLGGAALKSINGRYLCAELEGGADVHANRPAAQSWEQWSVIGAIGDGAQISLLARDGRHYLTVRNGLVGAWSMTPILFQVTMLDAEVVTTLSPLHRDGYDLKDAQDKRALICETTNFLQFYRFRRGEEMAPTLYAGFDTDRVTLTMSVVPGQIGWPPLDPRTDPEYFSYLNKYLAWKRSIGRRSELTVFCDQTILGTDRQWRRNFLSSVYELASSYRDVVLIEWINEVGHSTNGVDPNEFVDLDRKGILTCSGSSFGGGPVPEPYIDYCTPHLTRVSLTKMLADGNFGEQVYGAWAEHPHPTLRPMLTNEIIGADEVDRPGSRTTDPNVFKEVARILTSRCGGAFHATDAVFSRPLGPRQDRCRQAFIDGFTGV